MKKILFYFLLFVVIAFILGISISYSIFVIPLIILMVGMYAVCNLITYPIVLYSEKQLSNTKKRDRN